VRRADCLRWWSLVLVLALAACSSDPKPAAQPQLATQAQNAETNGARRYAQGAYAAAAHHFAEALRLRLSLDDGDAAARNRLQLAHTLLALEQPQPALEQAMAVDTPALQVQTLLLQAQARLAMNRSADAHDVLVRAEAACASCPERGRLRLLQGRVAWAVGDMVTTIERGRAALPLLREQGEEREVANANRLLAAAQLRAGDPQNALASAQAALDMDRRLALPEKIARDWLLIGDIHRRAVARSEAAQAYRRAQSVAQAAGLSELARLAQQAMKETNP